LQATSLTLGWTGTLSPTRGGTGVNNGSNTLTLAGNLATSGAFSSTLTMTGITTVTFPTTGTLATTAQLPTPAALTKTDDTNVTVTLGGSPSTALLQATSLTLGWTGQLAITRGGTGVSSVTTSPAASSFAGWNANNNLSANNFLQGYSSTATAAAITTLLVSSSYLQYFTGSTTQDIVLPVTSTLVLGQSYKIINDSTGILTIYSSAILTITTASPGETIIFTCILTSGTSPTSWSFQKTRINPAALTKTDDTNVTLTLGGSPTTALLNAASLTLGWTGQLGLTRGGTAASLTASNGGIVYSTATAMAILAGTATAGQLLQSGSSAAPSWSTSTYPATNAANTLLYASSANVMAALATANNGVLVTSAGGVPSISSTLPSGISATNMNLTTPTLGVAAATSINFGGTALANYLQGSITPTIASSGGGSVTYSTQSGSYTRIGNRVIFNFQMGLATNSLSAGTITLAGLPTNCVGNVAVSIWCVTLNAAAITQIMGYVVNGTTTIALSKYAAGATTSLADTDLAGTTTFIVSGSYPV
jgi:hypothetical protein